MNYLSLLFLAVLLSACQSKPAEEPLCDFQSIIPPGKRIDCGYINVPENHDRPAGKKIKIAYVVLQAEDSVSPEFPVIYLSGGPGSSSIHANAIDRWYNHPFRLQRDVILLDQRGIGYSSALPNMYRELHEIMAADLTAEAERQRMGELISKYSQKCQEMEIDLASYNSFQNAQDVGALMDRLGHEKYNLYGGSYGTRLARIVQELFPEKLNAVILNSPNPLQGDMLVDRLKSYSLALSRVITYCKNNPECHAANPTLETDYINTIKALDENPLMLMVNGDSVYLNAHDGIFFVRRILYGTNSRSDVPALLREFQQGGGPLIQELVAEEYTDDYNFTMWLAVERHEMYDPANTLPAVDQVYQTLPLLPARLGLFESAYLALERLHNSGMAPGKKSFLPSDVPTLITVNQYDPVTPPENGRIMMQTLSKGQLFILDEGGHGGGNAACRNQVMVAFMNEPNAPLDVSCLNLYQPEPSSGRD